MNLLDYECPHHILDNRTKETSEVTSAIFLDMSTEWVYYTVANRCCFFASGTGGYFCPE